MLTRAVVFFSVIPVPPTRSSGIERHLAFNPNVVQFFAVGGIILGWLTGSRCFVSVAVVVGEIPHGEVVVPSLKSTWYVYVG